VSQGKPLLEELFQKIIGPLAATGVSPLLFEPDNVEDRVSHLLNLFNRHPQFIPPFQALIKSLNPQDREVPLEEHIRFYTTNATRLWLMLCLMNQILKLKEIELDFTTGKLPGKPHELLKFSNEARNLFGEESRYKDQVFAAGFLFDYLLYLHRSPILSSGQKLDEPISQAFSRAVEQGLLCLKLSKFKKKLTLDRQVPVTCFLRQLSQVTLLLLKGAEAIEFYKKLSSLKHTEPVRLALEKKTFGVHTGILSTFLAQLVPAFDPLDRAMSVWGWPSLISSTGDRDLYDLCAMGMLGTALKEQVKGSDFKGAGAPGSVLPELSELDLLLTAEVKNEAKI
jgi:hypothetical protein